MASAYFLSLILYWSPAGPRFNNPFGSPHVYKAYRSLHFALEQPWVADAVVVSLVLSMARLVWSSFDVKRTYLKLRVAEVR